MGNNVPSSTKIASRIPGSTKITYRTKQGLEIDYIYYDLRGRNRFPKTKTTEKQIQTRFYQILQEIEATEQQLKLFKDFNPKLQERFIVLHERKVQYYKEKHELERLRVTILDTDSFIKIQENRRQQIQEKLELLENSQTGVKMNIVSLQRMISQKNMYSEFIKINGIKRLLSLLDKAITANNQGTKTIFQTQIEILKFLKIISDHNPKDYFSVVGSIRDYAIVLMRAYHPVNTAVTAYALTLLQDYSWKVQNNLTLMQSLKLFKQQKKNTSLLQLFVETIYHTENILMCYYNLKFINEMLISIVDEQQKQEFEQQLRIQRFQFVIEEVKNKLQQNLYKIDQCTFIAVSQAIYKHATRNKQEKQNLQQNLVNRDTLSLQTLQHHLLVNFVEGCISKNDESVQQDSDKDEETLLPVYLAENDKRLFNKFILDTFTEIQHFYKYNLLVDEGVEELTTEEVNEEMEKLKKNGLSVQQYFKRIKGTCLKNQCQEILLSCFKALQYFQKHQWKKLEGFINEGMKTHRNVNEVQNLKKEIEEKEKEIRILRKECHDLKTEIANRSMPGGILPPPPLGLPNLPPPLGLPDSPPPPLRLPNIPPPPLDLPNLPPPPLGLPDLPPPPIGLPNLPPPPKGLPNLPPPPIGLPNLPPPPLGLPNLPPPPMGLPNLPPPPLGLPSLPPPPLNLPNLPPPPLGLPNLPPPPMGLPNIAPPPLLPGTLPLPPPPGSLNGIFQGKPISVVQQKKKAKKQPKVNLKACNYIVLSYQKIKSTIWQNIEDSKIEIDENQVQTLFARAMPKKEQSKLTQSAIHLPLTHKKEKIKLLAPDKHRNLQIVLTKLKLPEQAITQILTQCSGKYATQSVLESIHKILPSEEDEMVVNSYDGSLDDLGAPQRYVKEISSIPQCASRVKTLIFAKNKDQIFNELQTKIDKLTSAFASLKSNLRIHHILQVALALGNYLNGTGIKGGAWGFRLDTIQNMQEVTSGDNKTNAGFYLIKQIWKKYPYPIFQKEEVDRYQYVQKMPISQVKSDLGELKKTLNSIEKALKSKNKNNPNDKIEDYCQELFSQTKDKYAVLEAAVKKTDQVFTQCATFYAEDPTKAASDQIGKKIFKCILFIFTTQKSFYEMEERQAKKLSKIQQKQPNLQSSLKVLPKIPQIAIKLCMPILPKKPELSASQRLKQLQKSQQEKQKKLLQQMMKKRSSKMVAFRQSRMAANAGTGKLQHQFHFLNGL